MTDEVPPPDGTEVPAPVDPSATTGARACVECGRSLSDDEKRCPDCGAGQPRRKRHRAARVVGLVVVLALLTAAVIGGHWWYGRHAPHTLTVVLSIHGKRNFDSSGSGTDCKGAGTFSGLQPGTKVEVKGTKDLGGSPVDIATVDLQPGVVSKDDSSRIGATVCDFSFAVPGVSPTFDRYRFNIAGTPIFDAEFKRDDMLEHDWNVPMTWEPLIGS